MTELEFKQFIFSDKCQISTTALLVLLFIRMQCRARYIFTAEVMRQSLKIKDIRTLRLAKAELESKGLIEQTRCRYGWKITIPLIDSDYTKNAQSEISQDYTENVQSETVRDYAENVQSQINLDYTINAQSETPEKADYTKNAQSQKQEYAKNAQSEMSDYTKNAQSEPNRDCTIFASETVQFLQSDYTKNALSDCTKNAPLRLYKDIVKEREKGKNDSEQKTELSQTDTSAKNSSSLSSSISEEKETMKESAEMTVSARSQTQVNSDMTKGPKLNDEEYQDISDMDEETQKQLRFLMRRFS